MTTETNLNTTITPITVTQATPTADILLEPVAAPSVQVEVPTTAPESLLQTDVVAVAPVVAPVETPTAEVPVAPVEGVKAPDTLLGNDPVKPVEEIKPVDKPITEGGQSDEPAPPPQQEEEQIVAPVYEPFTLPEGVSLDNDKVSKFTELLSDLETKNKGMDHALVQEFGQKAVDFHINEIKQTVDNLNKLYQTSWQKTKNDWKDQFLKDPEIGGNRFQTTLDSANSFIRTHGGSAEEQANFRNLMETSGLGNHPTMIRILAKAGAAMSEGKPLAASKPAAEPKSKTATLYGKRS